MPCIFVCVLVPPRLSPPNCAPAPPVCSGPAYSVPACCACACRVHVVSCDGRNGRVGHACAVRARGPPDYWVHSILRCPLKAQRPCLATYAHSYGVKPRGSIQNQPLPGPPCVARVLAPTHYSLLTARYSPLTTHYSLLTTHYSLLTAHCSLLIPTRRPAESPRLARLHRGFAQGGLREVTFLNI